MAAPSESLYARGFAADAETERALRAGLAGRETRVQRCRFDTALRTLAAEPSPKLVFVDLDGAPEPELAVRELTAVCAFGTALIAIGTNDTAQLTRALLREGIADYLVKPLSAAAVRAASATALDDLPERMYAGRVVAFAGTAGSGVCTLVTAIARTVATGARTASVVELNPGSVTLSALLGVEPAGNLAALLASLGPGQRDVERDVDPPLDPDEPRDSDPAISAELVDSVCAPTGTAGITLLGILANRTHVVLVAGLHDPNVRTAIMQQADARVLLYEPTLPSISAAVHCLALLGPEHPITLVQTHPRMRRSTLSQAQIRYALAERSPDVIVPFEPALHAAATGDAQDRPPGKAYLEALRQVIERAVEGPTPLNS